MTEKPKITVIGFGKMGQYYAGIFAKGFEVSIVSSRQVDKEAKAIGATRVRSLAPAIRSSQYVFLAVPINALDAIVTRINRYVGADTVVIDTCSARLAAERKLSQLKCRHFGIHGGVFTGKADPVILEFLEKHERKYESMSAEEHDRLTATGLVHFMAIAIDSYLSAGEKQQLKTGTVGPLFMKIIDHIKQNSKTTYKETQLLNPFMKTRRNEFIKALVEYNKRLDIGEFPFLQQ